MAVPKTTQTRYMEGSVQRTTQVTPSLHLFFIFVFCTKMFPVILQQSLDTRSIQKKRCRDGVYLCSPLHTAIHISSLCGFWHCHPYILLHFGKCFSYLFACIFCCTTVPYRRLSFSKLSINTFLRARKNTAGLRG